MSFSALTAITTPITKNAIAATTPQDAVDNQPTTIAFNPGAMTLFQASPQDHFALAKHLTAEIKTEEFVAGKGVVVKWQRIRRQNHWLDALYNASAAGH